LVKLPVITGFGGINPAGRSSGHHGYKRIVIDSLSTADATKTYQSLAQLMGRPDVATDSEYIKQNTLIRRLINRDYDPDKNYCHLPVDLQSGSSFVLPKKQLPSIIPEGWQLTDLNDTQVSITLQGDQQFMLPSQRVMPVQSAGQLPTGFDPSALYSSHNHPRALQMAVYGSSDAVSSMGIEWDTVKQRLSPDQMAVYSGGSFGQMDFPGSGGMMQSLLLGKRVSSKQLAMGMPQAPGDFINAYVLGSVGSTGSQEGACATFLYNLNMAAEGIKSGRFRAILVGNSDAPLVPELFEGFNSMSALASDKDLRKLDGLSESESPDYRRASRPFGENCGFTMSESAQFFILMDDELALELGATIYGSVGNTFINADGYKKSISAPGPGNYITMAKSVASAQAILGKQAVQQESFVQAHGSSTPQNRTTESHILNEVAKTFGIKNWPVTAMKAHLGHSISASAADQLANSLGAFAHGVIPGITTLDRVADDVFDSNLNILTQHREVEPGLLNVSFLNTKGFGGNNATAAIFSPKSTLELLAKKHGQKKLKLHAQRNEKVAENTAAYDDDCIAGKVLPRYNFGEGIINSEDVVMTEDTLTLPGFDKPIDLPKDNPFLD